MNTNIPHPKPTPPSAPPVIRAGRWTTALGFISIGVLLLLDQNGWAPWPLSKALKLLCPSLLILLGMELLLTNIFYRQQKVRLGGVSLSLLLVLLLGSVLYPSLVKENGLLNQVYHSPASGTVDVEAGIRKIKLELTDAELFILGTDENKLVYDGEIEMPHAGSQAAADRQLKEQLHINREGDTLVMKLDGQTLKETPLLNWGIHTQAPAALHIQVPKSLALEVSSRDRQIIIDSISAKVTAATTNAPIEATHILGNTVLTSTNDTVVAEDITGDLNVRTTNGDIRLDGIGGVLDASTTNSAIRATSDVWGNWHLKSTDGDIAVTLPTGTDAKIKANTTHGSVTGNLNWSSKPADGEELNQREAKLGQGSHVIELQTTNSDIEVNQE